MNKKLTYFAPETEVYVLQNEGCLCSSPNGKWDDSIKSGTTWESNDDEDYGLV